MPGMLSSAPQAEMQGQPAQEGMLSGTQPAHKGYNGTVDVEGKPVQVRNGVAEAEGDKFFVTDDGLIVFNQQMQPLGYIENGVFKFTDENHRKLLKSAGYIQ